MSTLHRAARWVRRGTWAVLATGLVLTVALAMFEAGRYSSGDRVLTVSPSVDPDRIAEVVADVESRGLSCSEAPSLAPSIVFEWLDGTVRLISFDEALIGARAGSGWVRWYCSPPVATPGQFEGSA